MNKTLCVCKFSLITSFFKEFSCDQFVQIFLRRILLNGKCFEKFVKIEWRNILLLEVNELSEDKTLPFAKNVYACRKKRQIYLDKRSCESIKFKNPQSRAKPQAQHIKNNYRMPSYILMTIPWKFSRNFISFSVLSRKFFGHEFISFIKHFRLTDKIDNETTRDNVQGDPKNSTRFTETKI